MTDDDLRGRYRHYKGHEYEVLGTAKSSETLEELGTAYLRLDADESVVWVRPTEMFKEHVEVRGQQVARFLKTSEQTLKGEVRDLRSANAELHQSVLQERVRELEQQLEELGEPGYIDALRTTAESVRALVPDEFIETHLREEDSDILEVVPDLVGAYIAHLKREKELAETRADANWALACRAYEHRDAAEGAQCQAEERLRASAALASTEDRPLPEDPLIAAASPATSNSPRHDLFMEAMRFVSAKHSKYALVDLVCWLLLRIEEGARGTSSKENR